MLPVETRLKRMEKRLQGQRFLNFVLLALFGVVLFQDYLPGQIAQWIRKDQRAEVARIERAAPAVAPQLVSRATTLDVENLKARRLSITDKQGRERMTLVVDANDSPFIIVKDEAGNFRATMAVQMDGRGAFGLWNTEQKAVHGVLEQKAEKSNALEISQAK